MNNKKLNHLCLLLLSITLVACNGGGGNSGSGGSNTAISGSVASLQFIQPYELASFESTPGNGYVVVSNTDESRSVNNIVYSLNSVVGGASKISIDSISAESCAMIESMGSCILKLDLESGAYGGSFVLGANNNSASILNNLKQIFSSTSKKLSKAPIGINQVATTTTSGINGIKLFYYPVINDNTVMLVITGSVLSNKVGVFNSAILLDESNIPLTAQKVLSANLGNGSANLKQGDSFSISIPAPIGLHSLSFKLRISEVSLGGTVSNNSTSATINTISTVSNQAILYNYPSSIALNPINASQTQVVANLGSLSATSYMASSSNPSIATVKESPLSSLRAIQNNNDLKVNVPTESSTSYTVSLTNPSSVSNALFNINQSYNNGKTEIISSIDGSVSSGSWPTPAPTPAPVVKYIFVTEGSTNGAFGGFSQADDFCNMDVKIFSYPNELGNSNFKALLNGNNSTTVGTIYKNLAGEEIATATTSNLVVVNDSLINPVGNESGGVHVFAAAWTGLARTGVPAANCSGWTSSSNSESGTVGFVLETTPSWAAYSAEVCSGSSFRLMCVQQ